MFKYNGELYLLATDQGYIYQPNLVWEMLNKDYVPTLGSSPPSNSSINSDFQLAIELQQQEFEQQQPQQQEQQHSQQWQQKPLRQQPQQHPLQQPSVIGHSRLVVGPQCWNRSSKCCK